MHPFAMQRVERVQVEDRFDLLPAIGHAVHFLAHRVRQGVAVEENEAAGLEFDKRTLRSDIEDAADAKVPADRVEASAEIDDVVAQNALRAFGQQTARGL